MKFDHLTCTKLNTVKNQQCHLPEGLACEEEVRNKI